MCAHVHVCSCLCIQCLVYPLRWEPHACLCVPCVHLCETTPARTRMCPVCPRHKLSGCAYVCIPQATYISLQEAPAARFLDLGPSVYGSPSLLPEVSGPDITSWSTRPKWGQWEPWRAFEQGLGAQTHLDRRISPASPTAGAADPKLTYLLTVPQSWVHWPAFVLKHGLF